MVFSAGCEYGIRAVARLAEQARPGAFILLRDIAELENIPRDFVGKVFQTLVRAEILASAKGRGGGFALRRPPGEISLRQIVEAIDGPARLERCVLGFADCNEQHACPQHQHWMGIRRQIDEWLESTTIADIVRAVGQRKSRPGRATTRRR